MSEIRVEQTVTTETTTNFDLDHDQVEALLTEALRARGLIAEQGEVHYAWRVYEGYISRASVTSKTRSTIQDA